MRLIDANQLKELIIHERDKIPLTVPAASYELVREKANLTGQAMRGGIRVALRCMERCTTIDAKPVVHGEWEQTYRIEEFRYSCDDIETYKIPCCYCCSICSRRVKVKENYCPNCGADMRERKET